MIEGGGIVPQMVRLPARRFRTVDVRCDDGVYTLTVTDCTSGFRCYRREVLETIDLDHIFSNGYSFLIEMIYYVQRRGYRIGEVPIVFEDRLRGQSKISRNEVFRALQTVFRLEGRRVRIQ